MIRINILYLQTVLIKQPDLASQYRIQTSNTFTENLIFSSAESNSSLETKNIFCVRLVPSIIVVVTKLGTVAKCELSCTAVRLFEAFDR